MASFCHALHAVCTKLCCFYDCSASVQQRRSLDPAYASNKTVVEYLATVSPELELANGSVQGMLYKTGEGCDLPCYG